MMPESADMAYSVNSFPTITTTTCNIQHPSTPIDNIKMPQKKKQNKCRWGGTEQGGEESKEANQEEAQVSKSPNSMLRFD